ncbi:MAG: efflux RND transporter permease subunit [Deltaproteobacteria bacterium]|nr:efflux RND transporter permease subunit [Deltaproteobacteria bacterium]MBW2382300.1 efflux RND transporter permease subunit [Deltaproteobacteria bacterium]
MNGAIAWFARNHVAANLLMVVLIVGGVATMPTLTQELIPEISLDLVSVSTLYPGASPQEIEASITNRMEEQLQGLQGVKHIHSTSAEGASAVTVELLAGEDVRARLDDIRAAVDAIDTLPDEAEEPTVKQIEISTLVLNVAVAGTADEWALKRITQQVRDEIVALPGITEADLELARPYEISIEVSESALHRFGLTFDDVVHAVQRSSLDLPGGSLKTKSGEILLRAKGQAYQARDFEQIALVSRSDGTRLAVGDVARVVDGFEESDQSATFDGDPAMMVQVYRVGAQKALQISATVRAYVDEASARMPDGVHVTVWHDSSEVLGDRLDTMVRNARGGFILVVLVLALFLRLRLALWVSLGIPISFLGAVLLMPVMGISINFISLLGFIVVLGIVVDDAIVVGENVHTHQAQSGKKLLGAIRGTQTIVVPVTFGVLTTMAAFAPLLFLPGPMGRITRILPMIVIACLFFSLVESMFVLPAHLGRGRKPLDHQPTTAVSLGWRNFQDRIARGLAYVIGDLYRPTLERAIEWRYLTVAVAVAVFSISAGLVGAGWLKFVFQENVEADFIVADVTMAQGTPADMTAAAVEQMQRALEEIRREIDAAAGPGDQPSIFPHVMTTIGQQPFADGRGGFGGRRGRSTSNVGEVQVEVLGFRQRDVEVSDIAQRWRIRVGDIPGAVKLDFKSQLMDIGGPIEVELSGHDLRRLQLAAGEVRRLLATYPGLYDISDSFRGGKQELEYQILPSAESLGLTLADLARQLRQGFYGAEVQTIQRGRDEVKVMVRYPAEQRRSLADVEQMRIRSADGSQVPFSRVARASLGTGYATIRHVDRRRVVSVTAEVDLAAANANEIVRQLKRGRLDEAIAPYPGVRYSFEGEQAEQREFLRAQLIGMGASLLVIYVLLAVPLGSYLQPLIIMSAIPFGFVGGAWGHLLLGYNLTMYSVIGLVALAGIVVNDSLVLVDYVNKLIEKGMALEEAIVEAGQARFRAILLTSLTTFVGLSPLMLETSMQARFMIPMAISIAFGVLLSSSVILFLVPVSYRVLEDVKHLFGARPRTGPSEGPNVIRHPAVIEEPDEIGTRRA